MMLHGAAREKRCKALNYSDLLKRLFPEKKHRRAPCRKMAECGPTWPFPARGNGIKIAPDGGNHG
jgi:hypothetical protein